MLIIFRWRWNLITGFDWSVQNSPWLLYIDWRWSKIHHRRCENSLVACSSRFHVKILAHLAEPRDCLHFSMRQARLPDTSNELLLKACNCFWVTTKRQDASGCLEDQGGQGALDELRTEVAARGISGIISLKSRENAETIRDLCVDARATCCALQPSLPPCLAPMPTGQTWPDRRFRYRRD